MINILITGACGQLGRELRALLNGDDRFNVTATDVAAADGVVSLDITDEAAIDAMVADRGINVIVNCAAWTAVDAAQDHEEMARRLNAEAVGNIARAAQRHGARVVHISTDYVYDGRACEPYREDAPTAPLGVYGITKLEGERLLREILPNDSVVLRTAWLYSPHGNNFVKTMVRLGRERKQLTVVFDQVGTPTCAHDLAGAVLTVITAPQWHPGTYHYSNEGAVSWFDFTHAIHRLAGITTCDVQPCRSSEYPSASPRPSYSVLDKSLFKRTFGVTIPYWEDSLRQQIPLVIENMKQAH